MSKSATLKTNERCAELKAEGKKIYNLGLGQSPFPVPEEIAFALRHNAHKKSYLPCRGLSDLRDRVADFYKYEHDLGVDANQVLIGTGSKVLLFMLQMVLNANVILSSPCWVSYAPQAKLFGRNIKVIHTAYSNGWKITAEELDDACVGGRLNLLILNSPSNPTSQMHSPDEIRELAKVAKRNDLLVVSDEIYSRLNYGEEHDSLYRYYPEGTIISSGLSKWCGAGGWRLGTFVFPKELRRVQDAMVKLTSESMSSTCSPVQHAATTAFSVGVGKQYLKNANKVLSSIAEFGAAAFSAAGIKTLQPQGGFYFFVNFEKFADKLAGYGVTTSEGLCEKLLMDAGVALLPGSDCMRQPGELSARLAFVNFDGEAALRYADDIQGPLNSEFTQRFCPATHEAIEAICDWTEKL